MHSLPRRFLLPPGLLTLGFILIPAPAFAFDLGGTTSMIMLGLILGSFTLMNLVLQGLFYFSGKYERKSFATRHTLAAMLPCMLAVIFVLMEAGAPGTIALNLGVILVSLGLALLPLQLHLHRRRPGTNSALILAVGGALLLALAFILAPIALFALILAHVALVSQAGIKARIIGYLTLAVGYSLLGYWGYQLLQQLQQV